MTGSNKTNPMTGGNVTNITPETYEEMNEEFEDEGCSFKIDPIPTEERIEAWRLGRADAPEVD